MSPDLAFPRQPFDWRKGLFIVSRLSLCLVCAHYKSLNLSANSGKHTQRLRLGMKTIQKALNKLGQCPILELQNQRVGFLRRFS